MPMLVAQGAFIGSRTSLVLKNWSCNEDREFLLANLNSEIFHRDLGISTDDMKDRKSLYTLQKSGRLYKRPGRESIYTC